MENDQDKIIKACFREFCNCISIGDYTMTLELAKEVAKAFDGTVYEVTFTPVKD